MRAQHDRLGFTLVETMVASSIATIVLIALASTLLFCQRLFRLTMDEAESMLALRDIRDRLLFRASPGLSSGLLTGKASADSASITMNWEDASEGPDKIRLVWRDSSFFNERMPHTTANLKWLKPGNFPLKRDWDHTVDLPRVRLDLGNQTAWILLPQ